MPPHDNLSATEVLILINVCAGLTVVIAIVLAALYDSSLLWWLWGRGYTGIFEW